MQNLCTLKIAVWDCHVINHLSMVVEVLEYVSIQNNKRSAW